MSRSLRGALVCLVLVTFGHVSMSRVEPAQQQGADAGVDHGARGRLVAPASSLPGVRRDIEASEYDIRWQTRTPFEDLEAGWHAPNRAQGFRSYFAADGVHVVPRTAPRPTWRWGLSLVGYGRGSASHDVASAELVPNENRIVLDRGEIDEYFVNSLQALEHGLVLLAPPDDGLKQIHDGRAVHLDLAVAGNLIPVVGTDGRCARFVSPSGLDVVDYAGLEAWDALGRALPAWMEAYLCSDAWTLRLLIDDREATYPVEIDLRTTSVWIGEVDQDRAWFGISVATGGDVNADGYDDVIVGALGYDNGEADEGAVFLYHGSSEGPSITYDWMVDGDDERAYLGRSVSMAGDVNGDGFDDVIVGVPGLDSGDGAWVFHGSPFGLSVEPDWTGQGVAGDQYGWSVGTAGDVNGDNYDDVVVGAYLHSSVGHNQDGAAYVYHGSASGLLYGAAWTEEGIQCNAEFGVSVGTAGDVNGDGYDDVIVGAWRFGNGENGEGRAYVYHGSPSGLTTGADWVFENDDVEACLGGSVATAGDVNSDGYDDVIVGAAYKMCWDAAASPVGKAYVFHGSTSGLATVPDWTAQLTQTGAIFGYPVAAAGDVNGDGYGDVIVGALYYDGTQGDEGAAFVYLGTTAGLSHEHAWMSEGGQRESRFGQIGRGGDVNADGYDDVIVGAYKYDNGEDDEGRAFLYLGPAGIVVPAGWVPTDTPLFVAKTDGATIQLNWGPSCLASDLDYEVYEGQLGDFGSHFPVLCSTGGQTETDLIPTSGGVYYLVVPASPNAEGSYGKTSGGVERPAATDACLPQTIGDCD